MVTTKSIYTLASLISLYILPLGAPAYAKDEYADTNVHEKSSVKLSLSDSGLQAQYRLAEAQSVLTLSPEQDSVRKTNWILPDGFEIKDNQIRRVDGTPFSNFTVSIKPDRQKIGRAYPGLITDQSGNTLFNLGYLLPSAQRIEVQFDLAENFIAVDGHCSDFSTRTLQGPKNRTKLLYLYIGDEATLSQDEGICIVAPNAELTKTLSTAFTAYQSVISGPPKEQKTMIFLMEDIAQLNGGDVGDVDDLGFVSLRIKRETLQGPEDALPPIFVHELGHVFEKFNDRDDFGLDSQKQGWLQEGFAEFLSLRFLDNEGYSVKSKLETHINDCRTFVGQHMWANLNSSNSKAFYSCGSLIFLYADALLQNEEAKSSVVAEYRAILDQTQKDRRTLYNYLFETKKYQALDGATLRAFLENSSKNQFWDVFNQHLLNDRYRIEYVTESDIKIINAAWVAPMLAGLCPNGPWGYWTADHAWTLDLAENCNGGSDRFEINQVNGINFLKDPWKAYEEVVDRCVNNEIIYLGQEAKPNKRTVACDFKPNHVNKRIVLNRLGS